MPEFRLRQTRKTLPPGYQFGDAKPIVVKIDPIELPEIDILKLALALTKASCPPPEEPPWPV